MLQPCSSASAAPKEQLRCPAECPAPLLAASALFQACQNLHGCNLRQGWPCLAALSCMRPCAFLQDMPVAQMLHEPGCCSKVDCLQVFQQKWGTLNNVVQFSQQLTPGGIAAVEANSHQVGPWALEAWQSPDGLM